MMLVITISSVSLLSVIAIVIPIYHEASAKECDNANSHSGSSNSDSSHNDASDGTNCSDKQDSNSNNDHEHSSDESSNVEKVKTPFILAEPIPFP